MADSYLLGASAGASFGYTLAALYAGSLVLNFFGLGIFQIVAFLGAVLTVFLVYFMSRVGNKVPITTLLLSGIVVNIFILALANSFRVTFRQGAYWYCRLDSWWILQHHMDPHLRCFSIRINRNDTCIFLHKRPQHAFDG